MGKENKPMYIDDFLLRVILTFCGLGDGSFFVLTYKVVKIYDVINHWIIQSMR